MPASMLAAGNWKKALLPSLPSRRRQQTSPTRPTLAGSNTVSGLQPALPSSRLGHDIASTLANNRIDDKVVNALLETTAETEADNSSRAPPHFHQDFFPRVTRSQTAGVVSTSSASGSHQLDTSKQASSPQKLPRKSCRRNLRAAAQETAKTIHKHSVEGLARPLVKHPNTSSSTTRPGDRVVRNSSSESFLAGHYKGDSPIRRGRSNTDKITTSATSVLAASPDLASGAVELGNSDGALKRSRSKTLRAFAKFTGVLSDHFGSKGSRKRDRNNNEDMGDAASDTSTRPLVHGKSHIKFSVTPSSHPSHDRSTAASKPLPKPVLSKEAELRARISRGGYRAGLSAAWKRLTIVDEADYKSGQPGQPTEDPFIDPATAQPYNEFQTRLKSAQGQKEGVTDPYQAERIFDSSFEGILASPPLGSSTPPRQQASSAQQTAPTKETTEGAACESIDDETDLITLSPGPPTAPQRRYMLRTVASNTQEVKRKPLKIGSLTGPHFVKENSRPDMTNSSDTTRLSSYPPGSTLRHVPRSLGNLATVPSLTMPSVPERGRGSIIQNVSRKKHPSPSKGQLELFGRAMEKNLTLGIFKDADELGMNLDSPQFKSALLSPKDNNSKLRTSATSHVDTRKAHAAPASQLGLSKSRGSRIPQPVSEISRSRTDSVVGRNRAGDSIDELQWEGSLSKIPSSPKKSRRCPHCGTRSLVHDPPCVTVQQLQQQSGCSTML